MLHLTKLAVGVRDIEHLRDLQTERAEKSPPLRHRTRNFPRRHHEVIDGGSMYWVVGGVRAVLFFACLLGHELAHSLVARRYGVKVSGITLWLFGGVSRLEGEPPSAQSEALIAGVGPLTSLAIGVIAFVLAWRTKLSPALVVLGAVGAGALAGLAG